MLSNCGAGKDSSESLGVNPKGNQLWILLERLMLKLKLQHFSHLIEKNWLIGKDPDAGKDWRPMKAGGEGDDRGWDGWMTSLTQRTWVWANSGSWWWTGRLGVLQLPRVRRDWVTELNWTSNYNFIKAPKQQGLENSQVGGKVLRGWHTQRDRGISVPHPRTCPLCLSRLAVPTCAQTLSCIQLSAIPWAVVC